MSVRVKMTKRAAAQVEAADDWWREHRPEAPNAVLDEIARAVELLASMPSIGMRVPQSRHPGDRRLVLRDVGFHLYYRVRAEVVEVLRLWHASRDPNPRL